MKNSKEYIKEWYKQHPWVNSLSLAKQRCTNPNNPGFLTYGLRGIKYYLTQSEGKELWFRDKAYEMKHPTIDRINNNGNYEFDNCRFIEKRINIQKDKFKIILQYNLEGKLLNEWSSQMDAAKQLNILAPMISNVCNGKYKQTHGFIFKFKNE